MSTLSTPKEDTSNCIGPWMPTPWRTDLYGTLQCEVHGIGCMSPEVHDSWAQYAGDEQVDIRAYIGILEDQVRKLERDSSLLHHAQGRLMDAKCTQCDDVSAGIDELAGSQRLQRAIITDLRRLVSLALVAIRRGARPGPAWQETAAEMLGVDDG